VEKRGSGRDRLDPEATPRHDPGNNLTTKRSGHVFSISSSATRGGGPGSNSRLRVPGRLLYDRTGDEITLDEVERITI
jgi:hypothetical protein